MSARRLAEFAITAAERGLAAAIREGATLEPSLEEGWRMQAVVDAVRTADVERRWVQPEPVLRMGSG
ncbi:MAG: hypothetical protein ACRDRZ_10390 [Pseudonocardiaceae bacterium]